MRRRATSKLLDMLALSPNTSRANVRQAFVQKLLQVHPDHSSDSDAAARTARLKEAWDDYEREHGLTPDEAGTFTTFGVGCSFDDSEEEQRQRAALQEQASHGRMNQRTIAESDSTEGGA